MPANDAEMKLGYDGKAIMAGLAALEKRVKETNEKIEKGFAGTASRVSSHFSRIGQGISQGLGISLWSTAVDGARQLGRELGGIDVAKLADAGINANEILDSLLDRATKLGTSAESLQRLDLFGAVNGRSPEEMADAMAKLAKNMAAVGDDPGARAAVETLGIDVENFAKLEPDRQIITLARAFQEAEKKGVGLAEIYELLGKGGGNLLQILRQPVADLEGLANAKVIPEEVVLRASEIADELTKAAEAKNRIALQTRTELQLSDEQRRELAEQSAERKKAQQSVRDATAEELKGNIAAAKKKENEEAAAKALKEQEEKQAKITRLNELASEAQALSLRASGRTRAAEKFERQAALKKRADEIAAETGTDPARAMKMAEGMQGLQDRIQRRDNRRSGVRNRIRGVSKASYDRLDNRTFNEFFHPEDVAAGQRPRDSFKQGFADFFYRDPMTGASGLRLAGGAAAVRPGAGKVSVAEGKPLLDVQQLILAELKKLNE